MIKKLFKFVLFLLILIIAAVIGLYIYAGEVVKTAVEKFVPEITQTDVRLHRANFALLKGYVSLEGLSIGNPKGYAADKAFGVKNITVNFEPKSVLEDKIIINQILIDGIQVDAEAIYQNGKITSNLTQIQKNVESFLAKNSKPSTEQKPAATETKSDETASAKQVVIRDLQINNTELTVGVMKQVVTVSLPNIQQKNIGEKKKTTWKDAAAYIFNKISTESVKGTVTAVQDALRKGTLQLIGMTDEAINAAKDAAKEKATAVVDSAKEKADSVISNTVGGAMDSVKGLLGK